jgi:hypothetical protein
MGTVLVWSIVGRRSSIPGDGLGASGCWCLPSPHSRAASGPAAGPVLSLPSCSWVLFFFPGRFPGLPNGARDGKTGLGGKFRSMLRGGPSGNPERRSYRQADTAARPRESGTSWPGVGELPATGDGCPEDEPEEHEAAQDGGHPPEPVESRMLRIPRPAHEADIVTRGRDSIDSHARRKGR